MCRVVFSRECAQCKQVRQCKTIRCKGCDGTIVPIKKCKSHGVYRRRSVVIVYAYAYVCVFAVRTGKTM